mmetsp:Transcript_4585/g.10044  ORF Transcript_4585/g.10044 Transcript_4585/m.10044 type:complete len:295 (-) Transcript_4585:13-897(-)
MSVTLEFLVGLTIHILISKLIVSARRIHATSTIALDCCLRLRVLLLLAVQHSSLFSNLLEAVGTQSRGVRQIPLPRLLFHDGSDCLFLQIVPLADLAGGEPSGIEGIQKVDVLSKVRVNPALCRHSDREGMLRHATQTPSLEAVHILSCFHYRKPVAKVLARLRLLSITIHFDGKPMRHVHLHFFTQIHFVSNAVHVSCDLTCIPFVPVRITRRTTTAGCATTSVCTLLSGLSIPPHPSSSSARTGCRSFLDLSAAPSLAGHQGKPQYPRSSDSVDMPAQHGCRRSTQNMEYSQ